MRPSLPQTSHPVFFRMAFARARPCYCYGCICLTPEEKAYERRVFNLARAWSRMLTAEQKNSPQRPV